MRWANAVHRVTGEVVASHRAYSAWEAENHITGWTRAGFFPECDFTVTLVPPVMAGERA